MMYYRLIAIAAACLLSSCASPPKAPMPVGGEREPANDPEKIKQFLIENEEIQRLSEQNAELERILMQSKGQVQDMKNYVLSLKEERSKPKIRAVKQESVISDAKQFKKKVTKMTPKKPTSNIVGPAEIISKADKPKSEVEKKIRESQKTAPKINLNPVVSASKKGLSDQSKPILREVKTGTVSSTKTFTQPLASIERAVKTSALNKISPTVRKANNASSRIYSTAKTQKADTTIKKDSTTYTFYHDVADTRFIPSTRVNEKMLRDANNATKVLVVGRADSRNNTTQNILVARERGTNAKRYLIDHGVDESLIKVPHLPTSNNLSSLGEEKSTANKHSVQITVFN